MNDACVCTITESTITESTITGKHGHAPLVLAHVRLVEDVHGERQGLGVGVQVTEMLGDT